MIATIEQDNQGLRIVAGTRVYRPRSASMERCGVRYSGRSLTAGVDALVAERAAYAVVQSGDCVEMWYTSSAA